MHLASRRAKLSGWWTLSCTWNVSSGGWEIENIIVLWRKQGKMHSRKEKTCWNGSEGKSHQAISYTEAVILLLLRVWNLEEKKKRQLSDLETAALRKDKMLIFSKYLWPTFQKQGCTMCPLFPPSSLIFSFPVTFFVHFTFTTLP